MTQFMRLSNRPLGESNYGTVYICYWQGHTAAAKLFNVGENEVTTEIRKEIELLQHFRSDSIIQFFGYTYSNNRLCLITSYASNGSLRSARGKKLTEEEKKRIITGVIEGMHYLHGQKMIHRDLKPENILLEKDYTAKLCDFGLEKLKQFLITAGRAEPQRSARWMAPELLSEHPSYSFASDVYAIGLVLWEILTRKQPYESVSGEPKMIAMIKRGNHERIPDTIPDSYKRMIEKCWEFNPEERASVNELKAENNKILTGNTSNNNPTMGDTHMTDRMDIDSGTANIALPDFIHGFSRHVRQSSYNLYNSGMTRSRSPPSYFGSASNSSRSMTRAGPTSPTRSYTLPGSMSDRYVTNMYEDSPPAYQASPDVSETQIDPQHSRVEYTHACQFLMDRYLEGNQGGIQDEAFFKANMVTFGNDFLIWIQSNATAGERHATMYGEIYYHGYGVLKRNYERAFTSFKWAAEQGYARAQFNLGFMYNNGEGCQQSDRNAFTWFKKAAEQGNVNAQCSLGVMYRHGLGVEKNPSKSAEWYTKAAQSGNATAQLVLAFMYLKGEGVAKSVSTATQWCQKAQSQGDNDAGVLWKHISNRRGIEINEARAQEWYARAAQGRFIPATMYGVSLFTDPSDNTLSVSPRGVFEQMLLQEPSRGRSNMSQTIEPPMNQSGANQRVDELYMKGLKYAEDRGSSRNLKKAVECFMQAATQGHTQAQFKLGTMYETGELPTDSSGSRHGQRSPKGIGSSIFKHTESMQSGLKEAAKWYNEAAKQNNADAFFRLALMHKDGLGVKQDLSIFRRYLEKARKLGSKEADRYSKRSDYT